MEYSMYYSIPAALSVFELAAVLGIACGHKGAVQVSSCPGEGPSFRLLFPPAGEGQ